MSQSSELFRLNFRQINEVPIKAGKPVWGINQGAASVNKDVPLHTVVQDLLNHLSRGLELKLDRPMPPKRYPQWLSVVPLSFFMRYLPPACTGTNWQVTSCKGLLWAHYPDPLDEQTPFECVVLARLWTDGQGDHSKWMFAARDRSEDRGIFSEVELPRGASVDFGGTITFNGSVIPYGHSDWLCMVTNRLPELAVTAH